MQNNVFEDGNKFRRDMTFFIRRLWLVALLGLIGAVCTLYYSQNFIKRNYLSTSGIYITKPGADTRFLTFNELEFYNLLILDLKDIAFSDYIYNDVMSKLGEVIGYRTYTSGIKFDITSNSRYFKIGFVHSNPQISLSVAEHLTNTVVNYGEEVIKIPDLVIVDKASLSKDYIYPNIKKNTSLGAGVGIFAGFSILFLMLLLNNTIICYSDIEARLRIKTLARVNKHVLIPTNKLFSQVKVLNEPNSFESLEYQKLCFTLSKKCEKNCFVFMSSPSDKHTMKVSINTAAAFSQLGYRTLLIDLGRESKLYSYFKDNKPLDYSSLLKAGISLKENVSELPVQKVDGKLSLVAAEYSSNSYDSLGFEMQIKPLLSEYEVIIVFAQDESALFKSNILKVHIDSVVYVVTSEKTNVANALSTIKFISNFDIKVRGAVFCR